MMKMFVFYAVGKVRQPLMIVEATNREEACEKFWKAHQQIHAIAVAEMKSVKALSDVFRPIEKVK